MREIIHIVLIIGGAFMALGLLVYLIGGEKKSGHAVFLVLLGGGIFILGGNLPLIFVLLVFGGAIFILVFLFGGGKPPV